MAQIKIFTKNISNQFSCYSDDSTITFGRNEKTVFIQKTAATSNAAIQRKIDSKEYTIINHYELKARSIKTAG